MKKEEYVGKCLFFRENKILIIGDLHLGHEERLNRGGIFVSSKLFEETIEELDEIFYKIGKVNKIILLGDIKDNFGGIWRQEGRDVKKLFEYLTKKCIKIIIIKGNHDTFLKPILRENKKIRLKEYYIIGDICFMHGNRDFVENYAEKIKMWILGHGHPAISMRDPNGVKVEKYKCFLKGTYKKKKVIMVPSFFQGMEGSDPRENNMNMAWKFNYNKFVVKVIGEKLEVFDFGRIEAL